jgi:dienelactone hydrolase
MLNRLFSITNKFIGPFLIGLFINSMAKAQDSFDFQTMRRGSAKSTETQCANTSHAIWIVFESRGDCIRYYPSPNVSDATGQAIIFMSGDSISHDIDLANYTTTADKLMQTVAQRSVQLMRPYIYLARPGTFGSSGDHTQRRRLREVKLVELAIAEISKRHGITELALAGQSGGGHLVGALLPFLPNLKCAVPAAGALAVKQRYQSKGLSRDTTGYADSYDPIEHIGQVKAQVDLRLLIVADPQDSNVPFEGIKSFHEKAVQYGIRSVLLEGQGFGAERHGLSNTARYIAAWCLRGFSDVQLLDGIKNLKF